MKIPRLLKHISILVIILVVPGFLYYLLQAKGKNRYRPLPFYGEKKLSGTFHSRRGKKIPDTLYYVARPVTLINLENKAVPVVTSGGKITVAQFFYTHDTILVPKMTAAMARLANAYKKNSLIQFNSITVDAERDTPGALKKFMSSHLKEHLQWQVYTGKQDSLLELAQNRLFVNAAKLPSSGKFIFSDKVILLDPQNHIRGYYQLAQPKEELRLNDELKVQVSEELRKVPNAN